MKSKLVIVESPSKSKTIGQYLGEDYIVLSSKGHIRDLAISGVGGLGLDIENNFTPRYEVIKEKKAVVKELKNSLSKIDEVFLATDPDREGEAISWHLREVLEIENIPTKRVIFNEITKEAILKAFSEPRDLDLNLVSSQETRRILDRIIGFKLSKLLQNKIKSKSAGRVQSATLKIICDKEKEIEKFEEEEFWRVKAEFEGFTAQLLNYKGKKAELKNESETDELLNSLNEEFYVQNVEAKNRNRETKAPFTTSSLQQEASIKLNFSSRKTMLVAQKLYEGIDLESETVGLITYMRTDSYRLSNIFMAPAKKYIEKTFGKEYVGSLKQAKKGPNVQDAHESVRPTSIDNTPVKVKKYLSKDEFSLYSLIYNRTLACLMKPAIISTTSVELKNNDALFRSQAQALIFDGYLKVYGKYESLELSVLPELVKDTNIKPLNVEKTQHFTKPPARFTEARLIKEMEDLGIGRPSTYSQTITTLKNRKYVSITEKRFIPSDQGRLTVDKLEEFFSKIISVDYTARMEKVLDDISLGEQDQFEIISSFYNSFIPMVDNANKNMDKIAPKFTGEDCPKCGSPMVHRSSRFGTFEACSNYPECKHIKNNGVEKVAPVTTGIKCTKCGVGDIVERTAKSGRNKGKQFYACNNFPKCKNMLFSKPTGETCPDCGNLLVPDSSGNIICQETKTCGYKKTE
jgi:DNA topoisomerase-1